MTVTDLLGPPGPVDYLVIEFPPEQQDFTGEMSQQLEALAASGTIRILRVLLAVKGGGGEVAVREYGAQQDAEPRLAMAGDIATLMASDELASVTQRMVPGTVVGVVIWENTWAAGFAAAARRAGGRVVATGRIPAAAVQED